MIEITSATSKRDLLDKLAACANEDGKLIVDIKSLPTFLTTPIAFTIFNYQISNYPRPIVWTSENRSILEFLKACQVDTFVAGEDTQSPIIETNLSKTAPTVDAFTQVIEIEGEAENRQNTSNVEVIQDENLSNVVEAEFHPKEEVQIKPETATVVGKKTYKTPKIQAKDLLRKDNYQRSTLLDKFPIEEVVSTEETGKQAEAGPNFKIEPNRTISLNPHTSQSETQEPRPVYALQTNFEQNLDNWLERIEATRVALNNLREVEEKRIRRPNFFVRSFQFVVASTLLSMMVVGLWILFPTNVYSVNVVSETKDKTSQLSLTPNRFLTQNRNLNATGEVEGSGKEMINLSQARGKVSIVNRSGSSVSFNRQGIILISSNGLEYRHVPVNGEPATFTVPARSDLNGGSVVLNVEAAGSGTGYNLAKDTILRVYNLKRDLIGSLLSAAVSEEVSVTKETGKKVIQESDLKTLAEQSNQKIKEQVSAEINLLKNETTYTDPTWAQVGEVQNTFTRNAGDVADTVGVTTTAKAKLYYLNRNVIEDELKLVNTEIKKLVDITSMEYKGDFENASSRVEITVQYKYAEKLSIDEDQLASKLSDEDFSKVKTQLKEEHPEIKEIEKKEQGLRFPGVPARINVNINEKN